MEGGGSAPHALPSAPGGLGGSAPDAPESVSIESVYESVSSSSRARAVCPECGHSWPDKAEHGTTCYKCGQTPSKPKPTDDEPTATTETKGQAPRPDPPPMTAERREQLEAQAVKDGYRQRDGQWVKIYQGGQYDRQPDTR